MDEDKKAVYGFVELSSGDSVMHTSSIQHSLKKTQNDKVEKASRRFFNF